MDRLTFGDWLDLEAGFRKDRDLDPAALMDRDKALATGLKPAGGSRADLLRAWTAARFEGVPRPSHALARWLGFAVLACVVVGLLSGGALSAQLLAYDGRTPVNVVAFLGTLLGLQVLALLALAVGLPLRRTLRGVRTASSFPAGLVALTLPLREPFEAPYGGALRWLLLTLTQLFGLAFFAGALATLVTLVTVTDLAFSWSTTLTVEPATVQRVVEALASPWSWFAPEWVPEPEVVRQTQYYRIEGRYATGAPARVEDLRTVGAWWPFLAMALVVYGCLPRLVTLTGTWLAYRRALRGLRLDTVEIEGLVRRLSTGWGAWERGGDNPLRVSLPPFLRGQHEGPGSPETSRIYHGEREGGRHGGEALRPCLVMTWRDLPVSAERLTELLRMTHSLDPRLVLPIGGTAFDLDGKDAAAKIRARSEDTSPIVIAVDHWEAPGTAIMRLARGLRATLGPARPLLFKLVLAAADGSAAPLPEASPQIQVWHRKLRELGDRYTGMLT